MSVPNTAPPALDPELVDPREASRLLSLGKTKTFELIRNGTLESVKIGKARRVRLRSIRSLGHVA